ncbi:MAG: adenylate kinase [Candidatus Izemoplasmatales bacterium]|jgi:adenylate kinase
MMLNLLILGKPGAGKGTQATKLLKHYHLAHISTGDIYREEIAKETPIGIMANEYVRKGFLVPDDITNDIVEKVLRERRYPHGFMLDGYPRTKAQAEALDKVLDSLGIGLTAVINIDISNQILIRRMTGRRICSNCQATYHINSYPPKKPSICDFCGGELIQREDDLESSILNRVAIYNEKTKPLLDYYSDKGLLKTFDGELSPTALLKQIVNYLERK